MLNCQESQVGWIRGHDGIDFPDMVKPVRGMAAINAAQRMRKGSVRRLQAASERSIIIRICPRRDIQRQKSVSKAQKAVVCNEAIQDVKKALRVFSNRCFG